MLAIDTRSRDPIYTQLEKQIVRLINLGVYEPDQILPSVRALACDLGVNPNTVAKAYKNLEQKEIIYTVAGKGAFISSTGLAEIHNSAVCELKKLLYDAQNAGVEKTEILDIVNEVWEEKAYD